MAKAVPTNTNIPKGNFAEVLGSNCVVWDGDDIPCLGICRDMRLTDAIYQEAVATCSLIAEIEGKQLAGCPVLGFSGLLFGCLKAPVSENSLIAILQEIINAVPCCDPCNKITPFD